MEIGVQRLTLDYNIISHLHKRSRVCISGRADYSARDFRLSVFGGQF